jgi:hypothetical protein
LLLGIFLNEAVLGLMGLFSTQYIALPFAPEILLAVSLLIMFSIFFLCFNLKRKTV